MISLNLGSLKFDTRLTCRGPLGSQLDGEKRRDEIFEAWAGALSPMLENFRRTFSFHLTDCLRRWRPPPLLKGAVSRQSSSFCLILPITRPIAMELKVSKEITCK